MTSKKKPGKPSDIQGKRAEFLLAFYPTYADASKRSKTRGIWDDFFADYWAAFPWRLPLSQDPDENDPVDYARAPANEEEEAWKNKVISKTETKVKLWLGRQGKAAGMKDNPWAEWLSRFRTPATPAPKKLADYQYYMQHEDFKGKITQVFNERKAGVSAKEQLNLRAKIARELFAAETQEVRMWIKDGVAEEHAAQLAKHEDALEGLPALDEEGMEEARGRFSELVAPLLEGLAAHTGYEISLLVGRPKLDREKLDIECLSMHAGVTAETPAMLDFSRADERAYNEVMKSFSRFVWGAHEYRNGEGTRSAKAASSVSSEHNRTPLPVSSEHGRTPPPRNPDHGCTPPPNPTVPPAALAAAPPAASAAAPPAASAAAPPVPTAPSVLSAPAAIPTDTFSDSEVRALVAFNGVVPEFDEFDFSDDIIAGAAAAGAGTMLPGLGLPVVDDRYNTEFAAPLSNELIMRLAELSGEAKQMKLEELKKKDTLGIERENNAARNYYMLYNLGLDNAQKETLWGGTMPSATKRKARAPKKKRPEKKTRLEKELGNSEESDDSGSEEEEEPEKAEVERPHVPAKRKETSARTAKSGQASSAWATTADATLRSKEYGGKWTALLSLWWKREETAGFAGTTKSHPAKMRPKEVGDWVSRARNYTPQISDPADFGVRFWSWWIHINPSWRTKERPMKREGPVSWLCLDYHGQNGFLNVLMCLKWWRDAMDAPSPDWEEAVDDVTWVLSQMNESPEERTVNTAATTSISAITAAAARPAAPGRADNSTVANRAEGGAGRATGPLSLRDNVPEGTPEPPPRPKPRPLTKGMRNREMPREPESSQGAAGILGGIEGLSQEELDEMNDDPDADMVE
ncbi:hypothetical protein MSAN_00462300 [Mycena sanguinolenta]|uniref:Uncharacterized protein n=1 Tax=Mycena sanguinolenta TaxID=230812 RepID=A0A8H6ZB74_9AGAR|nr:hypothetical protein MSAN_00462300 [Mycena sanguinolenta]